MHSFTSNNILFLHNNYARGVDSVTINYNGKVVTTDINHLIAFIAEFSTNPEDTYFTMRDDDQSVKIVNLTTKKELTVSVTAVEDFVVAALRFEFISHVENFSNKEMLNMYNMLRKATNCIY